MTMTSLQLDRAVQRARLDIRTAEEVTDDIALLLAQELIGRGVPVQVDQLREIAAKVVHGPARHLKAVGIEHALEAVEHTCGAHQRDRISPAMHSAAAGDVTATARLDQLQQTAAGLHAARRSVSALLVNEVPFAPAVPRKMLELIR